MFGFDEGKQQSDLVYNDDHQGHFSHELLAGGAAFMAMRKFEDHQRGKGEVINHGFAKELLAGFAGAEVDKLAETRGMNMVSKEEAKHKAKKQAEQLYDQQYNGYDEYNPTRRHPTMDY